MSTYNKVPKIYSNHGGHCEIAMYGIYAFVGKSRRRFLSQPIDPNTPGLMDVLPSPGKNTHDARRRNKLALSPTRNVALPGGRMRTSDMGVAGNKGKSSLIAQLTGCWAPAWLQSPVWHMIAPCVSPTGCQYENISWRVLPMPYRTCTYAGCSKAITFMAQYGIEQVLYCC